MASFNFKNLADSLALAAGLLPVVSNAVQVVEQPGLSGSQKAQAVTQIALGTLNTVSPGLQVHGLDINALIQGIIASVVQGFNLVGLFKHSTPTPAPVLAPASTEHSTNK